MKLKELRNYLNSLYLNNSEMLNRDICGIKIKDNGGDTGHGENQERILLDLEYNRIANIKLIPGQTLPDDEWLSIEIEIVHDVHLEVDNNGGCDWYAYNELIKQAREETNE